MGHSPAEHPPEVPKCPVCGESFTRGNLVLCKACSAPHHRRCWSFNKGCATYACHCRTFLLPPVSVDDELTFKVRGRPSMMWVMGIVPTFLFLLMLTLTVIPKAFAGPVLAVLIPGYVLGMLSVTIGPLLTERRYHLDAEASAIHKETYFGPVRVASVPAWRTYADVEELDVRSAQSTNQQGGQTVQTAEIWLRDRAGERTLLERGEWSGIQSLIDKAEAAADSLDTTVGLPREAQTAAGLPAGLGKALAALPRSSSSAPDDEEPS